MGSQQAIYPMWFNSVCKQTGERMNIEGRLIAGTEIFLSTITSRQLAYKVHLVGSEKYFFREYDGQSVELTTNLFQF